MSEHLPPLPAAEADGGYVVVLLRAEEEQPTRTAAPRVPNSLRFGLVVLRGSHHPEEHAHVSHRPCFGIDHIDCS